MGKAFQKIQNMSTGIKKLGFAKEKIAFHTLRKKSVIRCNSLGTL